MFEHIGWLERDLEPVFRRFANLVAAAERDACAKVCQKIAEGDPSDPNNNAAEYTVYGVATECADAIRARGNA